MFAWGFGSGKPTGFELENRRASHVPSCYRGLPPFNIYELLRLHMAHSLFHNLEFRVYSS